MRRVRFAVGHDSVLFQGTDSVEQVEGHLQHDEILHRRVRVVRRSDDVRPDLGQDADDDRLGRELDVERRATPAWISAASASSSVVVPPRLTSASACFFEMPTLPAVCPLRIPRARSASLRRAWSCRRARRTSASAVGGEARPNGASVAETIGFVKNEPALRDSDRSSRPPCPSRGAARSRCHARCAAARCRHRDHRARASSA